MIPINAINSNYTIVIVSATVTNEKTLTSAEIAQLSISKGLNGFWFTVTYESSVRSSLFNKVLGITYTITH